MKRFFFQQGTLTQGQMSYDLKYNNFRVRCFSIFFTSLLKSPNIHNHYEPYTLPFIFLPYFWFTSFFTCCFFIVLYYAELVGYQLSVLIFFLVLTVYSHMNSLRILQNLNTFLKPRKITIISSAQNLQSLIFRGFRKPLSFDHM